MNPNPDYYEILGVSKHATDDEIKKNFRKLARECHPDIAGDSPEIAERFSLIRRAYEVLIDPEKRKIYDNPPKPRYVAKQIHRKKWRPPGGHSFGKSKTQKKAWRDPNNSFSMDDMLNVGGPRPKPKVRKQQGFNRANAVRGEDISITIQVPQEVAVRGGSHLVEYRRLIRGDGMELHSIDDIQYIRIPPNQSSGSVLRVEKYGNAGRNGGVYGDLLCTLQFIPESTNQSNSNSSLSANVELKISIPEAILGGRVTVETSEGEVTISIPPYSSSGRKLRLRGKGPNGSDLILQLKIVVPPSLDAESVALIRQFAALNPLSPRD